MASTRSILKTLETLDAIVRAGTALDRRFSIYGRQFANMPYTYVRRGLPPFVAMQNH